MWHYRISGLEVATDIRLPGAQSETSAGCTSEIIMRRAPVPESLNAPTSHGLDWAMADGCFLWRVPNVARFLISHGREILFAIEDGIDESDAVIYLLGSAFGILLHQRGHLVLHASAVAVNGKAVLFCGPSGAGKSTLAAALAGAGRAFLNDDVCHIAVNGSGAPTVPPDGRLLKLWQNALTELALEDRKVAAVAKRLDKFYVFPPGEPAAEALPLAAIYGLHVADARQDIVIEKLDLAQAVVLLRHNAYRPLLVAEMRLEPNFFGDSVLALRYAGAFNLTCPADLTAMPRVIQRLEAHWQEIGL
jgi:hypothetical protein